uniref:Uncharacterized protein n=1 Tax=Lotus japonicus TaxID=34305 RepID=I3T0Y6_LOTJA|nr:unknown [Lotus japonicus]
MAHGMMLHLTPY